MANATASPRRQAEHLNGALTTRCSGTVRVRIATARDRGQVRRIECAAFGRMRFLSGLWRRTGNPDAMTWIAEVDGRPAGYLIAYENELDGRPIMYVGGVGVLPSFRRNGIGARLMDAVRAGRHPVWLHVRANNAAAIAMYRKLGMCELGRVRRFYANGEDALVLATPDAVPENAGANEPSA
jgi:ribosomal protein S18 acetylase RimI-like enzyme